MSQRLVGRISKACIKLSVIDKYKKLKEILRSYGDLLVAYSGGVDSSFLLKIAHDVLGNRVMAVIAASKTYPEDECRAAVKYAEKLGVRYRVTHTKEFRDEKFLSNPPERCYYCKKELFSRLVAIARKEGIRYVADGSNVSDLSDFRPGANASKEYGIKSPLREAGFAKDDIRKLSRKLKVPSWNKPSLACLASRIPYGTRITGAILKKIDKGEKYLRGLGFKQVRVRHYGDLAKIEVERYAVPSIMKRNIIGRIEKQFKKIGYKYVKIDPRGYRTGSMNEALTSNKL